MAKPSTPTVSVEIQPVEETTTQAVSIKTNDSEDTKNKQKVTFRQMFRFASSRDLVYLAIGIVAAMGNGAIMPLFSIILGGLFDALNIEGGSAAKEYALYFVYLGLGSAVLGLLQVGLFTLASERISMTVRKLYLNAVLRQDIKWFDINNPGEVASKSAENTILIREALGEKLGTVFQNITMCITGFAVGFAYNWELTLVILACAPFLAITGAFMAKFMGDAQTAFLDLYAGAGAIAEEAFGMIRTVASLGVENRITNKFQNRLQDCENEAVKKGFYSGLGMGSMMAVMFGSYALAFWYGSNLIIRSRDAAEQAFPSPFANETYCTVGVPCFAVVGVPIMPEEPADVCACSACACGCLHPEASCVSGGDILLVFFSVLIGASSLGQAGPGFTALVNGMAAAHSLYEVIDSEPTVDKADDTRKAPDSCEGNIEFKNVEFSYPSRPDVRTLKNFSLSIPKNKTCALVGGSGSGKSTVVALIERFYDPLDGQILLDGNDLTTLNAQWLRNQVGLVGQEPVLFATTIYQNIAYGLRETENVSKERVIEAAKMANAHDFIMGFPLQYDTPVGEKGSQLSGGQKQRIAIARSMIRDPTILLLDEATSALDNESERIVQQALDNLLKLKKRTTVVIAHRLTTIRDADKIVVMEQGEIVEQGNHATLLAKDGHYAALLAASERTKANENEPDRKQSLQTKESKASIDISMARVGSSGQLEMVSTSDGKKDSKSQSSDGSDEEELYSDFKYSELFQFVGKERIWLIPGCVSALLVGAQLPVFSVLFANLVTVFFMPTNQLLRDESYYYSMLFVALAIAQFFCMFFQMTTFTYVGEKITTRLRLALFRNLIHQDVGYFDLPENSTGSVTTRISTETVLVRSSLTDRLALAVQCTSTVACGLGIAFAKGWELTLVLFALLPLLIVSSVLQMKTMTGFAESDSESMANSSQVLQESVMGARTVGAFNLRSRLVKLYSSMLEVSAAAARRKAFVGGLGFGFSQAVMFALYAVAFYVGGLFIDNENMDYDFNKVLNVFFAVIMLGMGIGQAASLTPDAAKVKHATSQIMKTLHTDSKVDSDDKGGKSPDTVHGEIKFKNVQFAYPTRQEAPVFKNLNLTVKPGTSVAFVGSSGSGKSTIVQLVERFYDPAAGTVVLDGEPLTELNVSWYRSNIGMVGQEPRLFRGTIAENIAMGLGEVEATEEQIIEAAKSANAHDFIMSFPDGYETDVGDSGAQLSGGQKQRIAIARAIVRDPSVLILDEATSALDNESERVVQAALDSLLQQKKRTTIIVAHRLSTIRNADKIVVLNLGQVVEAGTHDELMAKGVYYPKLYNMQAKK